MIIRRTPADFRVVERLAEGLFVAGGSHAVYEITKTSLTTPEAAQRLASQLKIKASRVEYAGLKDKHAVTTQCMSVEGVDAPPEHLVTSGFEARLAGAMPRHLQASDIACNRFEITVREATRDDCRVIDARGRGLLLDDGSLGFVNYFGEQRMGSSRHGAGFVARRLVEGDFEGALKLAIATPARKDSGSRRTMTRALAEHWGHWSKALRHCPNCPQRAAAEVLEQGGSFKDAFAALPFFEQQMFVEAFQSHLWNATVAALVRKLPEADVVRSSNFDEDGFLFPAAVHWTPARRDLQVPMLSDCTELSPPWDAAAIEALKAEGLRLDQLRIPGLRRPAFGESLRPVFAAASEATITAPEADDLSTGKNRFKRTLRFTLPRGAYATVLLRALGQ